MEKGSVDLPTLCKSKQVKKEAATKSFTIMMEEYHKAKIA